MNLKQNSRNAKETWKTLYESLYIYIYTYDYISTYVYIYIYTHTYTHSEILWGVGHVLRFFWKTSSWGAEADEHCPSGAAQFEAFIVVKDHRENCVQLQAIR